MASYVQPESAVAQPEESALSLQTVDAWALLFAVHVAPTDANGTTFVERLESAVNWKDEPTPSTARWNVI
jgi:hypothetical protein